MLVTKRNKKGNPQMEAKLQGEQGVMTAKDVASFGQEKAKTGGAPIGVKAILSSAKKPKEVSAKAPAENLQPSAKAPAENPQLEAKSSSEAYLKRLKERYGRK